MIVYIQSYTVYTIIINRIPPTIQTPKFLAFVQSAWIDGLFSGDVGCPTSGINSAYFGKALLI